MQINAQSSFRSAFAAASLLLTLVDARADAGAALLKASQPEAIVTRQMAFSVPFRVQPGSPAAQPVEVLLYVSENLGGTWRVAARAKPDQRSFSFRAEHDGEYWFMVRTQDRQGRVRPEGSNQPEMKVLVDTAQPTLELSAQRGDGGGVTVRWRARDPNLQPYQLQLDYQSSEPAAPRHPLSIDPSRTKFNGGMYAGEVTWWPPSGVQSLVVRAEILDAAGNRATAQSQVALTPGQSAMPGPSGLTLDAGKNPVAATPAAIMPPALGSTASVEAPKTSPASSFSSVQPANSTPADKSRHSPAPTRWPVDNATPSPLSRYDASVGTNGPLKIQRLPSVGPGLTSASLTTSNTAASSGYEGGNWIQPPLREVQRGVSGAVSTTQSRASLDLSRLAPGERPRMVNSRSFQLEYDVESVGPWGIRRVELWGTRDGGSTWTSFGVDADNASPLTATVVDEGLYGFRIVVQGGNGMVPASPRSGEKPEIWLVVDLTRPICRLLQVQPGSGDRFAVLHVTWDAHDARLADRPVALLFSDQPAGPWNTIAAGLENTGQYTWQIDNRVPDRFFVRLEVRDAAGNLQTHQLETPVVLARPRPTGRIREVRPAG